MVTFREITKENYRAVFKLTVHDHQKDQVATNMQSVAVGHYNETAWFKAIYHEEEPVGFIMLDLNTSKDEFWVWRFMIDKNHQGKGYGKAAINLAKQVIKEMHPNVTKIFLSYVPKEKDGSDGFYKKLGFIDTGKKTGDEVLMRYDYE